MPQNRPFKSICRQLVAHGVRSGDARRYVSELRAHHADIITELTEAGLSPADANHAADRRIGDAGALAEAKLKQLRSSTFAGRRPLVCFSMAPAFALLLSLTALAALLAALWNFRVRPIWVANIALCSQLVLPGLLAVLFYRAARRRVLPTTWRIVPAVVIVICAPWLALNVRLPPQVPAAKAYISLGIVPSPSCAALIGTLFVPIVCAAFVTRSHVKPLKCLVKPWVAFVVFNMLALGCGGCATPLLGGRVNSSPVWDQQQASPTKVYLIVSLATQKSYMRESADEINQVAVGAIRSLPKTELVGLSDARGTSPCPSDAQAAAFAKSHRADAVCVLAVQDYRCSWGIGAYPPGWFASDYCLYSLRLIDVRSGELLECCVSACEGGGWGIPRGRANLKKDLSDHLVKDLTPHGE